MQLTSMGGQVEKKKSFSDALWCRFAVYPSLDVFAPHTEKKTKNQNNPKKKKH